MRIGKNAYAIKSLLLQEHFQFFYIVSCFTRETCYQCGAETYSGNFFTNRSDQVKVGRELKVLIDKKEAGRYLGRTEFDSVEVDNEVVIHSQKKLNIGEFYKVKITKAYDYDIEGEIVDNS